MSVDITRSVEVEVTVSAFDLGQAFARMDSGDQALFFNGIAAEVRNYKRPSSFQWSYMRDDMNGLPAALSIFQEMAEYAP